MNAISKNDLPLSIIFIFFFDTPRSSVMVDFFWNPKGFYVGLKDDVGERFDEVENQPDIDHFYVGCGGKVVAYTNEHGGDDEHHSDVEGDDCLEEERLEVVCAVTNKVQNQGWDKDSQDNTEQSPA